ncbi:MAG: monovalent cation/H(+) antiporter subunit G [Vulcanimicrobiota bacterium]
MPGPVDLLVIAFLAGGLLFFLGTVLGVMRLPDFYTRMHGAAKGDTLSSMLLLSAFAIHALRHIDVGEVLLCLKFLFIVAFVFVASPTASHALIEAGYQAGFTPWVRQSAAEEAADVDS